jgi:molecular chaperone Hsp33
LTLRGLARWQSEVAEGSLASMAGEGKLTITIESGSGGHRYQGVVPLTGDSLAECIQAYFEQSEQLQTRLWLSATQNGVAGMLLQRGADSGLDDDPEEREAWNRVCILADTLSDEELLSLSDEDILHRLFHEEDVRMFESAP